MTLGRTGLGARSTRSPFTVSFTRDRSDGGGGGPVDDAGDVTDDDSSDDEDDDSSDDDSSDDEDDDDAPLKPAGTKALKAERDKVKDLRRQLRELRAAKPNTDAGKDGSDTDTPEAKAAREAADTERARELAKPVLVRTEARRLLTEAGLIGKPDGLLRMLDLKAVDIDYTDDGDVDEIDGLADQIDALTEDYPTLFRKKGGGGRIDGADKGGSNGGGPKKKSASEIQAAGLRGGR